MDSDEPLPLKTSFRRTKQWGAIYTGGRLTRNTERTSIACLCTETVKVIDTDTWTVSSTLEGDGEQILCIAYRPGVGRNEIAGASRSLQLLLWEGTSGAPSKTWKGHDMPIICISYNYEGSLLATGASDGSVRVWDADDHFCTHVFREGIGLVSSLTFHPADDRYELMAAGESGDIKLFDLRKKSCIATLGGHMSAPTGVSVSDCGNKLASIARDKVVNVWDLRTNKTTLTIPTVEELEGVAFLTLSSSSARSAKRSKSATKGRKKGAGMEVIVTVGKKGRLRVWGSESAECLWEEPAPLQNDDGELVSYTGLITLNPEAANSSDTPPLILCTTAENDLIAWRVCLEDDKVSCVMVRQVPGYNDDVIDTAFLGKSNTLAVATNSAMLRVLDLDDMRWRLLAGHTDIVMTVAASHDGSLIASAGRDNTVRLWASSPSHDISDPWAPKSSSSDNEVSSGKRKRGDEETVEEGDGAKTGSLGFQCVGVCVGHTDVVSDLGFSNRSAKFVASVSNDRTLKLWNLKKIAAGVDGETVELPTLCTLPAHDKGINAVAVAPNDRYIASASHDKSIKLWSVDVESPHSPPVLAGTLKGHKSGVWGVAFSPVDRVVASSSGDRTIRLWSIKDLSCLRTFEGHSATVLQVAFVSKGMQLLSTGADGLLKLWTIRSEDCVATCDDHTEKVWTLAVAADEMKVVTGAGDSVLNVWEDVSKEEEAERAKARADMLLNQQALDNALHNGDYLKALRLALELDMPTKMLTVLRKLWTSGRWDQVEKFVDGLEPSQQLSRLLQLVRDWNSMSTNFEVSQRLLRSLLLRFPPSVLLKTPGIADVLAGVVAFTEKHLRRFDKRLQQTALLDYTVKTMQEMMTVDPSGSIPAVSSSSSSST
eukprot:Rmarinus@m.11678